MNINSFFFIKKDSRTFSNSDPDFTECFEMITFKLGPCLLVWLSLPFWFHMVKRERDAKAKVTWLSLTKTVNIHSLKISSFVYK
jgi:hypothetical protein